MNYKDTLNLPKTDFPMRADLVRREPELLARWEQEDLYGRIQAARRIAGQKFVLHDGPPFANGDVHMGTALNKILKDFIVKHKSMSGFYAPYVPGWDCHGLPIEFKVVKGNSDLSPVQVRQKCEAFARKYIDVQRLQFKRLGVLGDWKKPYLTLDKTYEADILRVFGEIVGKGLVYRSRKPVYWSSGAQTALAEAEVEYAERESPAVYVKFEVAGMSPKTSVVIWTTTPWTLPANLAVAVHPRFPYAFFNAGGERVILCDSLPSATCQALKAERIPGPRLDASALVQLKLKHPFLERQVPVLRAEFVTSDTGTGCVHVAPGHGHDDYHLAKHLGLLSPVDDCGRFTAECGVPEWVGKYVFDANKDVIQLLRSRGVLLLDEIIRHSYPHCWRSKTPVIFRAVEQWFIRVDAIKPQAISAISAVRWVPLWGENRIRSTVESRSDWCISRQRSWGVPLPIFYRSNGEAIVDQAVINKLADLVEQHGSNVWFERTADELATELGLPPGLNKRNETLDVWIDSGSSHRAVLTRHPDLCFPADVYLEGSDQHRGWFQSSLLISVAANNGHPPYRTVITNGFLMDLDGKKISKSSAYQTPKDAESFVNKYGADIVRLWVASENYQNDVPLSEEIFTRIQETYRSIRNTLRILLANLYDFDPQKDAMNFSAPKEPAANQGALNALAIDRWMLSRLQSLIREVREAYDAFEFHKVYHAINAFCAVEISALYVDITKDRMYCDRPDSPRRRGTQTVMHAMAGALTRLLAPILSFTAEETWGFLSADGSSVHLQLLPEPAPRLTDKDLEARFERLLKLRALAAVELEKARQSKAVGKSVDARVILEIPQETELASLRGSEDALAEWFIVSQVELRSGPELQARVTTPLGKKCARSWRWDATVGQDKEYPDLSARDAEAVRNHPLSKQDQRPR
ncbi:MAG: isoleucine--tRNA ligase [Verrucomicrobia bacterium]|nr:isoleucine--tRNA ligase [Verrucomicrobiota bacterium]